MKIKNFLFASILAGGGLLLNVGLASAQTSSSHQMMHGDTSAPAKSMQEMHERRSHNIPTLPGQDAFGAIQEIVSILDADPSTDWSKVDISALRSHLVDMNLLIMDTVVNEKSVDDGLEMVVTGRGRTLHAILAMVPAHASMINGMNGWNVKAEVNSDSVKLIVTSTNPKEVAHIRGLGFYGLMASGSHHQAHHLALAQGKNMHAI